MNNIMKLSEGKDNAVAKNTLACSQLKQITSCDLGMFIVELFHASFCPCKEGG